MELVERAPSLSSLTDYAAEAAVGNGRFVLVAGEAGIGKTALLEEFQRRTRNATWLWGACDGLFTPRPLGLLFDIAGQIGGQVETLGRDGAPREELFAAFLRQIDASPRLMIVAAEDIHWADEATLDLLRFLGRRLSNTTTLLIATYRDDELGETHPLRVALGALATQRATRRITLPRLSAGGRPVPRRRPRDRSCGAVPPHRRQPLLRERGPGSCDGRSTAHRAPDRQGRRDGQDGRAIRRCPPGVGGGGGDRSPRGPHAPRGHDRDARADRRRMPPVRDPGVRGRLLPLPSRACPDGGGGHRPGAPASRPAPARPGEPRGFLVHRPRPASPSRGGRPGRPPRRWSTR